MSWNSRYVKYSQAHGRTPEQQMEQDRIDWPGGCMCGFVLWIQKQVRDMDHAWPGTVAGGHVWDQQDFDAWLSMVAS